MKSRIQPEKLKEVEQGFQKPSDEPPVISNGRWQTERRNRNMSGRPSRGCDISGE